MTAVSGEGRGQVGISMADQGAWKQLYRYWLSKHVDGLAPTRADIDPPVEVPRLIPNVMLIDIVEARFRYRLVGSAIWDRYQADLTGSWIEGRSAPEIEWRDTVRAVRDDQVARLVSSPVAGFPDRFHVAVAMPLRDAGGRTSQIFAGIFFAQEFGDNLRVGPLTVREMLDEAP